MKKTYLNDSFFARGINKITMKNMNRYYSTNHNPLWTIEPSLVGCALAISFAKLDNQRGTGGV